MSPTNPPSPPPTPKQTPWTESNGVSATYALHCHCGAVRFSMTLSPPLYAEQTEGKEQCVAVECNCSHCERQGSIAVHPLAKDVVFTQGLEDRGEYLCGVKKNPHWFCKKCGCYLGTDLTWLMSEVFKMENRCTINLRMLKDLRLNELKIRQTKDMKHLGPKYEIY